MIVNWPGGPLMRARRAPAIDVLVALVATSLEIALIIDHSDPIDPVVWLLSGLAGAMLLFRRLAPVLVLAATTVPAVILVTLGDYPQGVPVLVALFTVADLLERRMSLALLVPVAFFLQVAAISSPRVSIAVWGLGTYLQTRRRYTIALQERAAYLEREREQLNEIAAQAERTSVARELHDIVAHSVTVMLVGVRGARDVLRTSPDVAEDTLRQVETSGEQSIAELRRILLLLRDPDRAAQLRPQPTFAQLGELIENYRKAGLPVHLDTDGPRHPLPVGVQLSVYRIVEEALTNVLKHSHPTSVVVHLRCDGDQVDLRIDDDGELPRTAAPTQPGHGILGMRERVSAMGGVLEAEPRPGGGFRVEARLPIGDAA